MRTFVDPGVPLQTHEVSLWTPVWEILVDKRQENTKCYYIFWDWRIVFIAFPED